MSFTIFFNPFDWSITMKKLTKILIITMFAILTCRQMVQADHTLVPPVDSALCPILKFQQLPLAGPDYFGHDEVSTAYGKWGTNPTNPIDPIDPINPGEILPPDGGLEFIVDPINPGEILPPDGGLEFIGYKGCYAADDFADKVDTPVICIRWWGSYIGQQFPNGIPAMHAVPKFLIVFETDVPATTNMPGHPGTPILSQIVDRTAIGGLIPGTFTEMPFAIGGCEDTFQYEAKLKCPFEQESDTVYWIKIVALYDFGPEFSHCLQQNQIPEDGLCEFLSNPTNYQNFFQFCPELYNQYPLGLPVWGWHNRDYTIKNTTASEAVFPGEVNLSSVTGNTDVWHFQDDAVQGEVFVGPDPLECQHYPSADEQWVFQGAWKELYYKHLIPYLPTCPTVGVDGPSHFDLDYYSEDLAFELWTNEGTTQEPDTDLGDAPDSSNSFGVAMYAFPDSGVVAHYPTVFGFGSPAFGPKHLFPKAATFLGFDVTHEVEADLGFDEDALNNIDPLMGPSPLSFDRDLRDDGLNFPIDIDDCRTINTLTYDVTVVIADEYVVNIWVDFNQDGDWEDTLTCVDAAGNVNIVREHVVVNHLVGASGKYKSPPFAGLKLSSNPNVELDKTWIRLTLSHYTESYPLGGAGWDTIDNGDGPSIGFSVGETEDYLVKISDDCLPSDHIDYPMWVAVGKPDCWCCAYQCMGDADCDGDVDADDYTIWKDAFVGVTPYNPCADFDRDGDVDADDFTIWKDSFVGVTPLVPCP